MKIVFLGATGMIGNKVIHHIADHWHDITAIVRKAPTELGESLPKSVRLVQGDAANKDSLAVIANADVVISMMSINTKSARPKAFNADLHGVKNALEVAKAGKAGKKPHFIYLSSLLQEATPHKWWVMDAKKEATAAVAQSGLAHTILRPANLMDNIPTRFQRGKSINYIGTPKEKSWWIAADDIARMLNAHLNRPMTVSYEIPMQGPDGLTAKEAAERYAAVKGLKVSKAPLLLLEQIGRFVPELSYATKISKAMNDAKETFCSEDVWAELGKPLLDIEGFARLQE